MKITSLAVTAAAVTTVLAQPHAHLHKNRHIHPHPVKREVTVTSSVPGATAFAYVLDGKPIDLDDVCKGISANQLKFADGNSPSGLCGQGSTTTSASAASSTTIAGGQFYDKGSTSSSFSSSSTGTSSAPASSTSQSWSNVDQGKGGDKGKGGNQISSQGGKGITSTFPDGTIDCSTFPSDYGAVPLSYLGLGGWSGLQDVTISGQSVTHIVTGISGQNCKDGMMCSYACPPGYQKAHWPSTQGATGQSIGGLQCKGGKLYLTNPSLSKSLCIKGVGGVKAQNQAGGVVAICRTDYPGTESETIPVELQTGETQDLTCPDAATYYSWQGKSTSAQYYLNPIGTPASQGCQWGSPGGNIGNYAPINFGVGFKDGKTWLSIFQNAPTTNVKYEGTVEIVGSISATCKYSNGQYCGATGCNAQGCTVAATGDATFKICGPGGCTA